MKQKIMIVEDDENISQILVNYLSDESFSCLSTTNFNNILPDFLAYQPDLVLLDISLPFYDGFHWCRAIRQTSNVPIIFLSSADDNMNIITAMTIGGDDFVSKPFNLSVLLAKVKSLLRRTYTFNNVEPNYSYKNCIFLPDEAIIKDANNSVYLTPNETRIIKLLLENVGEITPRETITEALWENGAFVDSNTLSVNITRLRKKLTSLNLEGAIKTIKGQGYKLVNEHEE